MGPDTAFGVVDLRNAAATAKARQVDREKQKMMMDALKSALAAI
ncbi:hypothetical protein [Humisphaera borealis]|nr:hypothetical protein [Humisphaera borealis]